MWTRWSHSFVGKISIKSAQPNHSLTCILFKNWDSLGFIPLHFLSLILTVRIYQLDKQKGIWKVFTKDKK